ncbi:hypothetical protein LXA43DRAFT_574607 [Ganoderma leucocontextum]|nr:hypothetical protein LXA43DRAFT_574607 [Ganoderma leucocontextum]
MIGWPRWRGGTEEAPARCQLSPRGSIRASRDGRAERALIPENFGIGRGRRTRRGECPRGAAIFFFTGRLVGLPSSDLGKRLNGGKILKAEADGSGGLQVSRNRNRHVYVDCGPGDETRDSSRSGETCAPRALGGIDGGRSHGSVRERPPQRRSCGGEQNDSNAERLGQKNRSSWMIRRRPRSGDPGGGVLADSRGRSCSRSLFAPCGGTCRWHWDWLPYPRLASVHALVPYRTREGRTSPHSFARIWECKGNYGHDRGHLDPLRSRQTLLVHRQGGSSDDRASLGDAFWGF